MNAPLTKSETLAHLLTVLDAARQSVIDGRQPKVDADYILIASSHEYDGLLLDLYGEYDEVIKRNEIYDVTLAGNKASLWRIVSQSMLDGLSEQFN